MLTVPSVRTRRPALRVGTVARASVRHGVLGLGVLNLLLPVVLLGRAVRALRSTRAARAARASRAVHVLPGPKSPRRVPGRRPPSATSVPPCPHRPACPSADAPDRDAARVAVTHPDQGWSLLCNGVVLFDDLGEILPDGKITGTGAQQVAHLRRYGSRRRRTAPPQAA